MQFATVNSIFLGWCLCCPSFGKLSWEDQRFETEAGVSDKQAISGFQFSNNGDYPITITSVKTSCGCTTAGLDKKTYQPGENGTITATFEFGQRIGLQRE